MWQDHFAVQNIANNVWRGTRQVDHFLPTGLSPIQ
jgi:hypothetical protein